MERPAGVPEGAQWNADDGVWELGPSKGGARHGAFTTWGADGIKRGELRYKEGKLHGPFRLFHAGGELAKEGAYRQGEFHGLVVVHRENGELGEPVSPGVSPTITKSELEYAQGRLVATRHFDKNKSRVAPDGQPYPDLPRGVPSLATFDHELRRFMHGPVDGDGRRTGLWMWWTDDGTLIEESEFREDKRDGVCRRYSPKGVLVEEGSFADDAMNGTWSFYDPEDGALERKADYDDGKYHGSVVDFGKDGRSRTRIEYDGGKKTGQYLARADKAKYAGGKIRVENGQYVDDVQVGRWKLLDKNLEPIATVDFGVPRSEADVLASPIVDDATRDEASWREIADKLKDDRKIGESLLATARAAAHAGDATILKLRLDEETAPLSERFSRELVDDVISKERGKLAPVLHALVGGGEAPRLLEVLASTLDRARHTRAALDFVTAGLLLDKGRASLVELRAVMHIRLGEADRARKDVEALDASAPDRARAIRLAIDALFPRFDFWPNGATPSSSKRRALAMVRDLSAVLGQIQKQATRYEILRRRALTHVDGILPWAPPDASPLLPIGEVPLENGAIDVDGRSVEVDETVPADDGDLPTLLAWLRASYAAMCWLCWACGADRPTLSRTSNTPRDLSSMANTFFDRHEALAGDDDDEFEFCGVPWREVPEGLKDVARLEVASVTACFAWLTDPSLASPFAVDRLPRPPRIAFD